MADIGVSGDSPEGGEGRTFACRTCDPSLPLQPGEVIKTAAEWDREYLTRTTVKPSLGDRLAGALTCPQCFRLRFSPIHLLTKWAHS